MEGLNHTSKGSFKASLESFQKCIQHIAIALATSSEEEEEFKKLIPN